MSLVSAEIIVTGIVQGVGFRYFCLTQARKLNLSGWVKNLPDGSVFSTVEGEKNIVDQYHSMLKLGPESSTVSQAEINWLPYENKFRKFEIIT